VSILRFINVVSAGIVTGAMAMELAVLLPGLRAASQQTLVEAHRAIAPRASRYVPIPGALAVISGVVVLFEHGFGSAATILTIAGLAAWIAAVLTTFRVYLPIVETMSGWQAGTVPGERESVVRRWASVHTARTALFACGFGLFVAAALAA
jgi:hypothetical protein